MKLTHGFELLEARDTAEIRSRVLWYRHSRTGAELLSVVSDDENKAFGVTFRTPPPDSSGIAHILEHSVLCGSERYPVKEPFVELLKGSLHTFLNAMTFPDKTCYPVASVNLRDFYNLVDVYLDAVFHPRLTPQVLAQEGWHYEIAAPDGPLTLKGVVYNEMKGVYSSPDSLLGEWSQQSLFPDTVYGLDSGGHPLRIPTLTFEAFLDFHRRYYHPSNARFFFSGDDDPEERLRRIDAVLSGYDRIEPRSAIPEQAPFPAPRRREERFPVDPASPDRDNGFASINWMLGAVGSAERVFELSLLSYVLVGTAASPLRKALIESGLGEDLAMAGLDPQLKQLTFSVGLRGMAPEDADRFERLTFDTLREIAQKGPDPALVEAGLNSTEFALRENNTGRFPRGLALMLRSLTLWLHDRDPFEMIAFEKPLAALKARWAREPGFLQDAIRDLLLSNPHWTRIVLRPDAALAGERQREESDRMASVLAGLDGAGRAEVAETARKLHAAQEAPDSPEHLASIPSLQLADLDRENRGIPCEIRPAGETDILWHDLFTGGLVYLELALPLRVLPLRLLPYVSIFGRMLFETGAGDEDYVAFTHRIGRWTGGAGASEEVLTRSADRKASPWLMVGGKATVERSRKLTEILRDALLGARLQDRARVSQMVLEEKADLESGLIPSGNRIVAGRLDASLTEAGRILETTGGIDYLEFIRALARRVEDDWAGVLADLEEIRLRLVRRNGALLNVTAAASDWPALHEALEPFLDALPVRTGADESWPGPNPGEPEALSAPSTVHFVGLAADLYAGGYAFHGSALVIARLLSTSWLWDRIRVQGGAYGAACRMDRTTGVIGFTTYRDPNLEQSLDTIQASGGFLRDREIRDPELTRAIIGAIGDWDTYRLPDAKGRVSLARHLIGDDEARRQKVREEILGTRPRHLREFGELLSAVLPRGRVAVLGPDTAAERLEKRLGTPVVRRRVL
jgi:Zn-dependent M16 (insulinase) family peptidase